LCLLTFVCLEIPWHIGRTMVPNQAPGVSGAAHPPCQRHCHDMGDSIQKRNSANN